jgi:phosphatidylserine/phosphatidylglycerophosphate/cardiolipin synthase-like enzyme
MEDCMMPPRTPPRLQLAALALLAFAAMIGAARSTIRLSQQDLGPPTVPLLGIPAGDWPDALFTQLGAAMVRGVDVYIVLSDKGSIAGGLSATEAPYSNGWTIAEVALRARDAIERNPPPGAPSGAALRELLCRKLHVAPLRFSAEDAFPDGVPYPNHAKLVLIDDQAFYIGSQNQYDAGLTEYGILVDDERAGRTLLASYFQPLWQHAGRKAVSGTEAATCVLM